MDGSVRSPRFWVYPSFDPAVDLGSTAPGNSSTTIDDCASWRGSRGELPCSVVHHGLTSVSQDDGLSGTLPGSMPEETAKTCRGMAFSRLSSLKPRETTLHREGVWRPSPQSSFSEQESGIRGAGRPGDGTSARLVGQTSKRGRESPLVRGRAGGGPRDGSSTDEDSDEEQFRQKLRREVKRQKEDKCETYPFVSNDKAGFQSGGEPSWISGLARASSAVSGVTSSVVPNGNELSTGQSFRGTFPSPVPVGLSQSGTGLERRSRKRRLRLERESKVAVCGKLSFGDLRQSSCEDSLGRGQGTVSDASRRMSLLPLQEEGFEQGDAHGRTAVPAQSAPQQQAEQKAAGIMMPSVRSNDNAVARPSVEAKRARQGTNPVAAGSPKGDALARENRKRAGSRSPDCVGEERTKLQSSQREGNLPEAGLTRDRAESAALLPQGSAVDRLSGGWKAGGLPRRSSFLAAAGATVVADGMPSNSSSVGGGSVARPGFRGVSSSFPSLRAFSSSYSLVTSTSVGWSAPGKGTSTSGPHLTGTATWPVSGLIRPPGCVKDGSIQASTGAECGLSSAADGSGSVSPATEKWRVVGDSLGVLSTEDGRLVMAMQEDEDKDGNNSGNSEPNSDDESVPKFVLSSGRALNTSARPKKPPTIDDEFESYFAKLLL